jgi:hypothetical protein
LSHYSRVTRTAINQRIAAAAFDIYQRAYDGFQRLLRPSLTSAEIEICETYGTLQVTDNLTGRPQDRRRYASKARSCRTRSTAAAAGIDDAEDIGEAVRFFISDGARKITN